MAYLKHIFTAVLVARLALASALGLLVAGLGLFLVPGLAREQNPMIQTEEHQHAIPPIDAAAPAATQTATFSLG